MLLQERSGNNSYDHDSLTLKYKLDNEFELVFVVAYQRILQLSYVDKFLDDIQLEFRDKYKDDLQQKHHFIVILLLICKFITLFIIFQYSKKQ
jgi:signal recognition particle receptor subunit alpha